MPAAALFLKAHLAHSNPMQTSHSVIGSRSQGTLFNPIWATDYSIVCTIKIVKFLKIFHLSSFTLKDFYLVC